MYSLVDYEKLSVCLDVVLMCTPVSACGTSPSRRRSDDASPARSRQVSFEVSRSPGSGSAPPPLPTRPSGGASRSAPGGAIERVSQRGWPGYASFDDLGDASFREASAHEHAASLWSRQGQARVQSRSYAGQRNRRVTSRPETALRVAGQCTIVASCFLWSGLEW